MGRLCFNRFLTKGGEKTIDFGGLKGGDRSRLLFPTEAKGFVGKVGLMKLIRAVMDVYLCDDYGRVGDRDRDKSDGRCGLLFEMLIGILEEKRWKIP